MRNATVFSKTVRRDHATSEIASGKLGIDTTKKIVGEGFKRDGPPLIKMDEAVGRNRHTLGKIASRRSPLAETLRQGLNYGR